MEESGTVKWPLSLETFLKLVADPFRISLNTFMPRYAMRSFTFREPSTVIATMNRAIAMRLASKSPRFIAAEKNERNVIVSFAFRQIYHATNRSFSRGIFCSRDSLTAITRTVIKKDKHLRYS